jgi:BirA family biotin operon repressor/biotin-[acetyl-CoA-carboxylase] ligase
VYGDPQPILDGLGLRIGLACAEFVESILPPESTRRVRLKWPNDVLIDGQKVLGVLSTLVQSPTGPWILIGVGLNANFDPEELPLDLQSGATTFRTATGMPIDLTAAANVLAAHLDDAIAPGGLTDALLERAESMLHGLGEPARVSLPTGEKVDATLVGLDASGSAVFEQDGSRWVAPVGSVIATV